MPSKSDAPETEAQPTAAAKGSSGGGAQPTTASEETTEPVEGEGEPAPLPPTEQESGGETAYTPQWLIDNSEAVLGQPVHVASGALATSEAEFLTVAQAQSEIDKWLETPVTEDTGEEE